MSALGTEAALLRKLFRALEGGASFCKPWVPKRGTQRGADAAFCHPRLATICKTLQDIADTEGGIFDATVHWSPKNRSKTDLNQLQNSSERVSKKYPLEGRAFGKTFT